jgi:hypothetical protein
MQGWRQLQAWLKDVLSWLLGPQNSDMVLMDTGGGTDTGGGGGTETGSGGGGGTETGSGGGGGTDTGSGGGGQDSGQAGDCMEDTGSNVQAITDQACKDVDMYYHDTPCGPLCCDAESADDITYCWTAGEMALGKYEADTYSALQGMSCNAVPVAALPFGAATMVVFGLTVWLVNRRRA